MKHRYWLIFSAALLTGACDDDSINSAQPDTGEEIATPVQAKPAPKTIPATPTTDDVGLVPEIAPEEGEPTEASPSDLPPAPPIAEPVVPAEAEIPAAADPKPVDANNPENVTPENPLPPEFDPFNLEFPIL